MIEVDAAAEATRSRLRTWMTGGALFSVIGIVSAGAVAFLGVIAIVLAVRPAAGETVVFASRS